MALLNGNKNFTKRILKSNRDVVDFSNIGGLNHHLQTLREVIIFPLLHANVFSHFKIKAPRGVIFYGPPGTGKTLVAGALATEINREGVGKVTFFHRKGADVLDKWVGESEKRLRDLFEKAAKARPAIIFFDEIDGLAPIRSSRNDQIHSSIVATLLSLMDGLDSQPGVVVIGATNRIETIDPALRRTGRFDKELYFPIPSTEARKEILNVLTRQWENKPTPNFIQHLAEVTGGFCGSDLQALCSEAVLCCMKRGYPNINNLNHPIKVEADSLKVEQCDFLDARIVLLPSYMKQGSKVRALSCVVKPLLDRQLKNIVNYIDVLWPHFLKEDYKYSIDGKRYTGRIALIGTSSQGLNSHLVPALLQNLEHLPVHMYDIQSIFDDTFMNRSFNCPSLILLSRVDEWWDYIDSCEQMNISASLEEIHAAMPILIIATCKKDIPNKLKSVFYSNSSIVVNIENPNEKERELFFAPLFFGEDNDSLYAILERKIKRSGVPLKKIIKSEPGDRTSNRLIRMKSKYSKMKGRLKIEQLSLCKTERRTSEIVQRKVDICNSLLLKQIKNCEDKYGKTTSALIRTKKEQQRILETDLKNRNVLDFSERRKQFSILLSDLLYQKINSTSTIDREFSIQTILCDKTSIKPNSEFSTKNNVAIKVAEKLDDNTAKKIFVLWKRTSLIASKGMTVSELELMYDVLSACVNMYKDSFCVLIDQIQQILFKIDATTTSKEIPP